jgi:hypothetical protein
MVIPRPGEFTLGEMLRAVKLIIHPFLIEDPRGAKVPTVLHAAPNVRWGVGWGANPADSKRGNDMHLTVREKMVGKGNQGLRLRSGLQGRVGSSEIPSISLAKVAHAGAVVDCGQVYGAL